MQLTEVEERIFTSFSQDAMGLRRLLSFGNEVKDAHNGSTAHGIHRMLDLFVAYRVLDLLALTEGIPILVSVRRQMKLPNLGCPQKSVCLNNL